MQLNNHGDGESLPTEAVHDAEELLGLVMDANADYRRGKSAVIEAAIRGGHHLLTAKEQLPHRDFLPFLERAGLEPRTAQRWMSLARTGWTCDTVSYLGGIGRALEMQKFFAGPLNFTDDGPLPATDDWAAALHATSKCDWDEVEVHIRRITRRRQASQGR